MFSFFHVSVSSLCRLAGLLFLFLTTVVIPARAQSTLARDTRSLVPLSASAQWRAQSTLRRIGALGAHTPLRRIQVIRAGQSTLSAASSAPVKRGAPLKFFFNDQFRADQKTAFNTFVQKIYPFLVEIYGEPAPSQQGRTIRIDKEGGASEGTYNSIKQTISYCPVLDCPLLGDNFTPADAQAIDEYYLTRLMLIAFHGRQVFDFDAWEFGFADAAALVATFRAAGKPANFDPAFYGTYLLPVYDLFNRPELGNRYFFSDGEEVQNLGFYRNGMAQAAWLKVYVENDQFFKQFNAAYYSQAATLFNDAAALENLAARFAPKVERLEFSDWVRRQHILDTRITPGDKLWVGVLARENGRFYGVAQYFRTEINGVENPLTGQVEVRAFDENGVDITDKSPDLTRSNLFRIIAGAAETIYGDNTVPFLDNTGSPDLGRVTLRFRVGNAESNAILPYNVAGTTALNGFYGAVINSNRGNVRITSATKTSTVPYARGAFGSGLRYPSAPKVKTLFALQPTDGAAPQILQRNSAWSWNGSKPFQLAVLLETAPGNTTFANTFKRAGTNHWRLISLPLYPTQSDEAKVLGVPMEVLKLARYRPLLTPISSIQKPSWKFGINTDKHDLYPRLREPIAPGRGFWLRLDDDLAASVRGGEPSRAQPFEVPLRGGWNAIGVPFKTSFALSAVRVRLGRAAPVSFAQAITNRWIVPGVWRWKTEGGYARVDSGSAANQVLQPFEGYYVFSPIGRGVFLIFDAATRTGGQSTLMPPTSATFWRVPMSVSGRSGRETDGAFGVSNSAAFLPAARPPLGERTVSLSFGSTGSASAESTRAGRESGWAESLIAPFASSGVWKFSIDGAQPGEAVRVDWGDLRLVPGRFDFVLFDETGGKTIPMVPDGPRFYTFASGAGARSLRIVATARAALVAVRVLWPSALAQIDYKAAEEALVAVRIETLAGEPVRTLGDQFLQRGETHHWAWDGRDESGQLVLAADGIQGFQVRITVVGEDNVARDQIVSLR